MSLEADQIFANEKQQQIEMLVPEAQQIALKRPLEDRLLLRESSEKLLTSNGNNRKRKAKDAKPQLPDCSSEAVAVGRSENLNRNRADSKRIVCEQDEMMLHPDDSVMRLAIQDGNERSMQAQLL